MKVSVSKIWNEPYHIKIIFRQKTTAPTMLLPMMLDGNIEKWMRLMKYEGECIKNMEWVESYKIVFDWEKLTVSTVMLPTMSDWFDDTINDIDTVRMWVH